MHIPWILYLLGHKDTYILLTLVTKEQFNFKIKDIKDIYIDQQ